MENIFSNKILKSDIVKVIVAKNGIGKKKNGSSKKSGSLSSY